MLLDSRLVHSAERVACQLEILDQRVASAPREVLSDNDSHQLKLFAVRRHRVRRHHPPSLAKVVRDREFIVVMSFFGIQPEGNERQPLASGLGHDDEPELLQAGCKVVGCAGQVEHDRAISALAETDHLVVLSDDLGSALGEIQGEGCLVCAEIIDVEDEFLGQVLGGAPDYPSDTRVDQSVLMARDVDRDDFLKAEIPFKIGHHERSNEASTGGVDVDRTVNILLDEKVIDCLDIFVLPRIGRADDGADADRVLIDQLDAFFRVDHVAVFGAENVAFFDLEVAGGFLPADLNSGIHNDVRFRVVFPFGFAPVLPALLHRQCPL